MTSIRTYSPDEAARIKSIGHDADEIRKKIDDDQIEWEEVAGKKYPRVRVTFVPQKDGSKRKVEELIPKSAKKD